MVILVILSREVTWTFVRHAMQSPMITYMAVSLIFDNHGRCCSQNVIVIISYHVFSIQGPSHSVLYINFLLINDIIEVSILVHTSILFCAAVQLTPLLNANKILFYDMIIASWDFLSYNTISIHVSIHLSYKLRSKDKRCCGPPSGHPGDVRSGTGSEVELCPRFPSPTHLYPTSELRSSKMKPVF